MLPSEASNAAVEATSSTGTGGSGSPPIVLTPTSSLDKNDNVVHNTTDASREAVANETNTNYHHYRADSAAVGHNCPTVLPYIMSSGSYGTTYPDFAGGNVLNWPSYQNPVLPHQYEPGVETCSNIACEGINQTGVGVKEMEFRSEQERGLYLDGWGLPKGGSSVEERLLRAINMVSFLISCLLTVVSTNTVRQNHYILVGHIDKTSCDINTEQRALEQRVLGKLHMLERKIKKSSPRNSDQPYAWSPSYTTLDVDNRYSIKRLDLAITQLRAHMDKLKSTNELLLEERVERKELEELLAAELLHHNLTMERMQAKISSLTKEVTCCWTEIRKLQDAVKGLESGAIGKKFPPMGEIILPPRPISMNQDSPMPSTFSLRMANTHKSLEKINEELERLKNDRSHTLCADPTHVTHCDSTRQKNPLTTENEDECDCDLCGKAKEWKSAGIGKRDEGLVGNISSQQENGLVGAKGNFWENPNARDGLSSGKCYKARDFSIIQKS